MSSIKFEDRPIMKCGCVAMALGLKAGEDKTLTRPSCPIHDCFEISDSQPDLKSRIARCFYYGLKSKHFGTCVEERPSSTSLWFFEYKPKETYDIFYCACRGDD